MNSVLGTQQSAGVTIQSDRLRGRAASGSFCRRLLLTLLCGTFLSVSISLDAYADGGFGAAFFGGAGGVDSATGVGGNGGDGAGTIQGGGGGGGAGADGGSYGVKGTAGFSARF